MNQVVVEGGAEKRHHPFAHVALFDTTQEDAAKAVRAKPGARVALLLASKGKISSSTCGQYSSSDMRVLAVHGLTRRVGIRIDGVPVYTISHKGLDVLEALTGN